MFGLTKKQQFGPSLIYATHFKINNYTKGKKINVT